MKNLKFLIVIILWSQFAGSASAENPLWMRYPSISPDGTSICFHTKGIYLKFQQMEGLLYH